MQSQFTDKAKTALLLAGRAAKSLHQNYVGTEHILLGLIKEGTGVASRVLTENGAKEEAIREMIQDLLAPETPNPVIERDGYSPRAEEGSGGKPQTGGKGRQRADRNGAHFVSAFRRWG